MILCISSPNNLTRHLKISWIFESFSVAKVGSHFWLVFWSSNQMLKNISNSCSNKKLSQKRFVQLTRLINLYKQVFHKIANLSNKSFFSAKDPEKFLFLSCGNLQIFFKKKLNGKVELRTERKLATSRNWLNFWKSKRWCWWVRNKLVLSKM